MRVRWLVAVCAFALLCATPLASARTLAGNLNMPGPITQEADGPGGATVTYFVSDSDPTVTTVSCSPGSGTLFPIDTTTVSCTGSDVDGNVLDTGSFTVTVQDTLPPDLNLPGTVNASSTTGSGVVVNYTEPTASDIVDGPITPSCSKHSGDTFPVGTTTVNCSASDTRGHTSSGG